MSRGPVARRGLLPAITLNSTGFFHTPSWQVSGCAHRGQYYPVVGGSGEGAVSHFVHQGAILPRGERGGHAVQDFLCHVQLCAEVWGLQYQVVSTRGPQCLEGGGSMLVRKKSEKTLKKFRLKSQKNA